MGDHSKWAKHLHKGLFLNDRIELQESKLVNICQVNATCQISAAVPADHKDWSDRYN